MAKYKVQSINYIISGRKEKILNLDIIKCEYPAYDILLQKEAFLSNVIETEHQYVGLSSQLQTEEGLPDRTDIYHEGEAGLEKKDQIVLHPYLEEVQAGCIEVQTKENILRKAYNKTIELEPNKTFILDIEEHESFDAGFYKHGFMNDDGVIIHPMYDIKDLALRSTVGKATSNSNGEFIDVYAPAMQHDPIGFCQCDSFAYGLMNETIRKPFTKTTNLYQQRPDIKKPVTRYSYQYGLSSLYTDTYLYKSLSELVDANGLVPDSYQKYFDSYRAQRLSAVGLSSILKPDVDLSCIDYNYILEVPVDMVKYNDFDSGEIQTDTVEGKNSFDPLYSMRMTTSKTKLDLARRYSGIGSCGGKIFLKYNDDISQSGPEPTFNGEIKSTTMVSAAVHPFGDYQKIEVIESIDRFESPVKHKSNLFSLEIAESGVNSLPEKTKNQLKQDIKNNIRQLVGILAPANTQLFDVYFTGK